MTNGDLLPVVFSVNCASGSFDNETANGDYDTLVDRVYFAERLLRKADGGAVGILGDTRNSPTWANSALTRGFFDAVWPNTVADFGDTRSHPRNEVIALGRAEVVDGQATIPFVRRPLAGVSIQLSASFDNAVSVKMTDLK